MAKAPSKSTRKPSATRSQTSSAGDNTPPTLNRSHLQGFIVGCVAGLLGAVGIFTALQAPEESAEIAAVSPPSSVPVRPQLEAFKKSNEISLYVACVLCNCYKLAAAQGCVPRPQPGQAVA